MPMVKWEILVKVKRSKHYKELIERTPMLPRSKKVKIMKLMKEIKG